MYPHSPDALPTLAQLRNRAGISQYRLSGISGVSRSTICRLEGGSREANVQTAIRLCEALGVAVEQVDWRGDAPADKGRINMQDVNTGVNQRAREIDSLIAGLDREIDQDAASQEMTVGELLGQLSDEQDQLLADDS